MKTRDEISELRKALITAMKSIKRKPDNVEEVLALHKTQAAVDILQWVLGESQAERDIVRFMAIVDQRQAERRDE